MNQLADQVKQYLDYCEFQKMLNTKTLKAYRIYLEQFEKLGTKRQKARAKNHYEILPY